MRGENSDFFLDKPIINLYSISVQDKSGEK
jgi:hypothetical protein